METVPILLGRISENNRRIKNLLLEKNQKERDVQLVMELKARTKTPLNERQQQIFHEFTGLYAKEGGKIRRTLMNMENTLEDLLHNRDTEPTLTRLTAFHEHQRNAIHSLRRLIASGDDTLERL